MTWRTGRTLGRTLYVDEHVVGMVDTPELAARIVTALNSAALVEECASSGSLHSRLARAIAAHWLHGEARGSGCACGWTGAGGSYAEHLSDVILPVIAAARAADDRPASPVDVITTVVGRTQATTIVGVLNGHGYGITRSADRPES